MKSAAVLLIWLIAAVHFGFRLQRLKQGDAYRAAVQALADRPEVHNAAGGPLRAGVFPRGGVPFGEDTAAFTVLAHAARGAVRAHIVLERFGDTWRVIHLTARSGSAAERTLVAENVERMRSGKRHAATGYDLFVSGQHREALVELDRAVRDDPRNAQSLRLRGFVHEALGDYRRAEYDFRRVVELDSTDAESHLRLGVQYGRGGDYRRSDLHLSRAIELEPDQGLAFFARAVSRKRAGRTADALADLERACSLGYSEACDALRTEGR